MSYLGIPDAHLLALTGHAREGIGGEVHFSTYITHGYVRIEGAEGVD